MKKIIVFCLAIILLQVMNISSSEAAILEEKEQENIDISYQLPFGGYVSMDHNHWTQITITLHNHGEAFEGEIQLVESNHSSDPGRTILSKEVALSKHEELELEFTLPLESIIYNRGIIRLKSDQKKDEYIAQKELQIKYNEYQPVIISDQQTDYHFFSSINQQQWSFHNAIRLPFSELPEQEWLIHTQLIILGPVNENSLSEKQIKALSNWVKSGGTLILSGGKSLLDVHQSYADFIPFDNVSLTSVEIGQQLSEWVGESQVPDGEIEIMTGQLQASDAIFPSDELPLFVGKALDNGYVLLSTYDIREEPLSTWRGSISLWSEVLHYYPVGYGDNIFPSMHHANSQEIPSVNSPSVAMIVFIWVIYLIVIGPILYLILKRMDKREWAWGIIPIIVLLTATSVYFIGLRNIASNPASHLVSDIYIINEESTRVESNASFLVIRGNDYKIQIEDNIHALGHWRYSSNVSSKIVKDGNARFLHYENVPYLTLTQARSMGHLTNFGYIDNHLYIEDGRLQGVLQNNTPLHLEEVELHIGNVVYQVGEIAVGEEKKVDLPIEHQVFDFQHDGHYYPDKYYYDMEYYERYHYEVRHVTEIPSTDVEEVKKRQITPVIPTITLQAKSKDALRMLSLQYQDVEEHFSNMIMQRMELQPSNAQTITFPYGILPVDVSDIRASVMERYHNYIMFSDGELQFSLYVQPTGVEVRQVTLPLDIAPYYPFEIDIWNEQLEEWEALSKGEKLILSGGEINKYLSEDGILQLKFTNKSKEFYQLPYPLVMVEGVWER